MSEVFRNDTEVYLLEIYKISYVGREIFKLNVSVATLIGNFVSHVKFESLLQPSVRAAYALLAISLPTSGSKKTSFRARHEQPKVGRRVCTMLSVKHCIFKKSFDARLKRRVLNAGQVNKSIGRMPWH